MKKYLVIGGSGLVGSRFIEVVGDERNENPDYKELDILEEPSIEDYFSKNKDNFDVVVNFAAYTNVSEAEKERRQEDGFCWKLNVVGAENVAKACMKYNKFLIHISTDFIFEGLADNPGPYSEDAKTPEKADNLSWYGWTKLEGEKKVMEINKNSAIVRIAYPFRVGYEEKIDFARALINLYDEGKLYPLFTDQIITPIYVDHLVPILERLADLAKPGIYHGVNVGAVSYYDFGVYLLKKVRGAEGVVQKGSLVEFLKNPERNKRPITGGLKTEKTQETLGMKFKSWQEAVDEFVGKLSS